MNKECNFKTADGFSIAAIHSVTGSARCVLLWLHGITVDKNEHLEFFQEGAAYFANKGIDSLRIDFRGHGQSSGSSLDFSVAGQMLDVDVALDYLFRYYDGQNTKLHIVACSFGAPPAIFTASKRESVAKLVLIAPVLSYERTFLQPETDWAKDIFTAEALSDAAKSNQLFINPGFPIAMRLIEEMRIIRPEIALRELTKPTVVIHGDADSMVPFRASKDIVKRARSAKLIRIRNMDHGFTDAEDETGKGPRSLKNKLQIYRIIERQFS